MYIKTSLLISMVCISITMQAADKDTTLCSSEYIFTEHTDIVHKVAFSPKGRFVVSASDDGIAGIWDADRGALVSYLPHKTAVHEAFFDEQGEHIVSSSLDIALLWDVLSKKLLFSCKEHDSLSAVALNKEGTILVTAGFDGNAHIWSTCASQRIHTLVGHKDWIKSIAFNNSETHIVTASLDGFVIVWDMKTGNIVHTLQSYGDPCVYALFNKQETQIAGATRDGKIRIWNATTGNLIGEALNHDGSITAVTFNEQGTLVSAGIDATLSILDIEKKKYRTLQGHQRRVNALSLSSDGARIASGSSDKTVGIWDVASGKRLDVLKGHDRLVNTVSFSPDGTQIASGSDDGTVRIWNVQSSYDNTHSHNEPQWLPFENLAVVEKEASEYNKYEQTVKNYIGKPDVRWIEQSFEASIRQFKRLLYAYKTNNKKATKTLSEI